jgi:hypothetical protein
MKKTQKQTILEHLQKRSITIVESINKYGIIHLQNIIYQLRREGFSIETKMEMVQMSGVERKLARYRMT